jgi:L-glutamine-phosphate cytidylyltransferase
MKGIILAAGKGSRLHPLTLQKPKGLLEIGSETILDRLINQFKKSGISDILIVVGHQKESLIDHFGDSVRYSYYKDFFRTNNLHTLWSVRHELNNDVLITFADLVVHQTIIEKLLRSKNDITMAIDTSRVLKSTMRIAINKSNIKNITSTTIDEADGNFIGISKLSQLGCKILVNEMSGLIDSNFNDYYTVAIDNIARRGESVGFCDIKDYPWREIDTKEEYEELIRIYENFS